MNSEIIMNIFLIVVMVTFALTVPCKQLIHWLPLVLILLIGVVAVVLW